MSLPIPHTPPSPPILVHLFVSNKQEVPGRMDGWRDGRGRSKGFEFARGRGEYRFRSLVQPDQKGRNYTVFCFAGYIKIFIYGCWWHVAHRIALRAGRLSRPSKTILGTLSKLLPG